MSSVNVHVLTGRLTRDAELKYASTGTAMMIFALAVDGFKEGDTSFFNCVLWGERAEKLSPMLTKGTAIGVTGRTVIESWEKDGVKHTAPKCHVSDVTILYKPKGEKKEEQGNSPTPQNTGDPFTDEIPF